MFRDVSLDTEQIVLLPLVSSSPCRVVSPQPTPSIDTVAEQCFGNVNHEIIILVDWWQRLYDVFGVWVDNELVSSTTDSQTISDNLWTIMDSCRKFILIACA